MRAARTASFAIAILLAFGAGVFFTTAGADLAGLRGLFAESHAAEDGPGDTRLSANPNTLEEAFTQVAERVNPTVVQITAERVTQRNDVFSNRGGGNPFEGTPFEDFFRNMPRNQQPDGGRGQEDVAVGLGSGVVVRTNGFILTNNHVVEGAENLRVRFFDGTTSDATIVGRDATSDLAVIRVQRENLPVVSFGTVESVRVGQWVMAFGSPLSFDFSNSVTAGIVSAVGRIANTPTQDGQPRLESFIQTDAAINPGNSGGPLVNLRGELVGLNSAIYTRTGGYQGIGFAIPVDVVRSTMDQLIETGGVRRARLGVQIGAVSGTLARARNLPQGAAQIGQVTEGSAADRAGLRPNDVIIAIDGRQLRDYREVTQRILSKRPGESTVLTIQRGSERRDVRVTLGEFDLSANETPAPSDDTAQNDTPTPTKAERGAFEDVLGFSYRSVSSLSARERQDYGLPESFERQGVLITNVRASTPAFRDAGLRPGMIITGVEDRRVTDLASFEQAYRGVRAGETFILDLLVPSREGGTTSLQTALTKR
jgi:serine protease Do